MMEFIRTFREKQQTSKEKNIAEEAQSSICLDDFAGKIFIAYNGAPLIPIEESWTQKEILKKLEDTRASYISYRMAKLERPKVVAAL